MQLEGLGFFEISKSSLSGIPIASQREDRFNQARITVDKERMVGIAAIKQGWDRGIRT